MGVIVLIVIGYLVYKFVILPEVEANTKKTTYGQGQTSASVSTRNGVNNQAVQNSSSTKFHADSLRDMAIEQIRNAHMCQDAERWFKIAWEKASEKKKMELLRLARQSVEDELPYCAESEDEIDQLNRERYESNTVYKESMALWYRNEDEEKYNYWYNLFYDEIRRGNYTAILLVKNRLQRGNWEYPKEIEELCISIDVESAMNQGDPWAMLAWGRYGSFPNKNDAILYYEQKIEYFKRAAEAGLSDGYYEWVSCLWAIFREKEKLENYTPAQRKIAVAAVNNQQFLLYRKACELDNGEFIGRCQCRIGEFYDPMCDDDVAQGCKKDYETALYWYRKAAKNKDRYAMHKVKRIDNQ